LFSTILFDEFQAGISILKVAYYTQFSQLIQVVKSTLSITYTQSLSKPGCAYLRESAVTTAYKKIYPLKIFRFKIQQDNAFFPNEFKKLKLKILFALLKPFTKQ